MNELTKKAITRAEAEQQAAKIVDISDTARMNVEASLSKGLSHLLGDVPYDRERYQSEIRMMYCMGGILRFEIGRRLVSMWEQERGKSVRTFADFVNKFFPDVPERRAYEDMRYAVKASKSPLFRQYAEGKGNFSKALALLEGVDDEELQLFEETGEILGIPVDDLDRMSVRELKGRIKKLEKEKEEGFEKADRKLTKDMTELKAELEILKAREEPGLEEAVSLIKAADKKILDGLRLLNDVPQELVAREKMLRDMLLGTCGMVLRVVENFEVVVSEAGQVDDQI